MNAVVPIEAGSLPVDPQIVKDFELIAAKIEEARSLFGEGDVFAAKMLASSTYDAAKILSQGARRAKDMDWVDKSRKLQGAALLIEMLSKMQIAREWDLAQGAGSASKGGRPKKKTVGNEDGFTRAEAGLTGGEIAEGRKLLKAEGREPGLVERAIAARIEAGLEPSRRAVNHAIGTKTASKEERGNNLYETPPEGMAVILGLEEILPLVLELFCGRGAISRALEAAGHEVILSDLVDYGTADRHGQVQQVRDIRTITRAEIEAWTGGQDFDFVSNPPYGEAINECILHILTEIRPRKLALLVNLNFLCGVHHDRKRVLDQLVPARAIVNAQRLPMMHRDGWEGDKASSQMNTMWLVWERDADGGYGGEFRVVRAMYSDFKVMELVGPAGGEACD